MADQWEGQLATYNATEWGSRRHYSAALRGRMGHYLVYIGWSFLENSLTNKQSCCQAINQTCVPFLFFNQPTSYTRIRHGEKWQANITYGERKSSKNMFTKNYDASVQSLVGITHIKMKIINMRCTHKSERYSFCCLLSKKAPLSLTWRHQDLAVGPLHVANRAHHAFYHCHFLHL